MRLIYEGREIELQGEVTMGRGDLNTIVIDSNKISWNHAKIVPTAQGWLLKDLSSSNGTFVDGDRVSEQYLRDGNKIELNRSAVLMVEASPAAAVAQGPPTHEVTSPSDPSGMITTQIEGMHRHLDARMDSIEARMDLTDAKILEREKAQDESQAAIALLQSTVNTLAAQDQVFQEIASRDRAEAHAERQAAKRDREEIRQGFAILAWGVAGAMLLSFGVAWNANNGQSGKIFQALIDTISGPEVQKILLAFATGGGAYALSKRGPQDDDGLDSYNPAIDYPPPPGGGLTGFTRAVDRDEEYRSIPRPGFADSPDRPIGGRPGPDSRF